MKNYKSIKSWTIVALLVLNIIVAVAPTLSAQPKEREKLITFNSYILINCNTSELSEPIGIETPAFVPLDIEYKHDIPSRLFRLVPFAFLRNYFFFGNVIQPLMHIKLEVEGIDNITVYFLQSDILTSIPNPLESVNISNGLVICPHGDASPGIYALDFTATSASVGRLKSADRTTTLFFTVE